MTSTASLPAAFPSPTRNSPLPWVTFASPPERARLFLLTETEPNDAVLTLDHADDVTAQPQVHEHREDGQHEQLREARKAAVVQYGTALRGHLTTVSAALTHCIDLTQTHANSATLGELRRILRETPAGGTAVAAAAGLAERLTEEQQHLAEDLEALRESVVHLRRLLQLGG